MTQKTEFVTDGQKTTLVDANQVRAAVNRLNERIVLADAIGETFQAAADEDNPPAWVFVYREQVRAISEASEALETLLSRSTGYGGGYPHGDTDDDASGSLPRATQTPCSGAACVP